MRQESAFGSSSDQQQGSFGSGASLQIGLSDERARPLGRRVGLDEGSPPVGQFVNPVVVNPVISSSRHRSGINPVVVNQVVVGKSRRMPAARARPGTNAGDQKCAALLRLPLAC
jgi:hypothetical protein